ncbi:GNAT family N-acetyltransferase [Massilia sp. W12]|uniref:GNAT family N-acetyltransferase n=1 Tax=Massilia sp. W12 TaxID=3126507 RepID=UPI0030D3716E
MSDVAIDGPACRISVEHRYEDKVFTLREARIAEAGLIKGMFDFVYNGKYPDEELDALAAEICDQQHNLCVVAVSQPEGRIVGCIMIKIDPQHRIGKGGRGLVLPEYRRCGLAGATLKLAIDFLCHEAKCVDLVYGASRTVSPGPMRMAAEGGMVQFGLFPNAVQIESMEHLNLDVYLNPDSIARRRARPAIIPAFKRIYELGMHQLGVQEDANLVQLPPLPPARRNLPLPIWNDNPQDVIARFSRYSEEDRIALSFFPFHDPNAILATDDGGTEVFIWYEGSGKRAAIVGYRSDRKNVQEILLSAAQSMEARGAAYLEVLAPAADPLMQQAAYAARFIPCAYFPAMRLARDGLRDDFFVLSRTFRLLDFSGVVISPLNAEFLRAYLHGYYELYIEPLLGPLSLAPAQDLATLSTA